MKEALDVIEDEASPSGARGLVFPDNQLMGELCGEFDANLAEIEAAMGVQIIRRGNQIAFGGQPAICEKASVLLHKFYARLEKGAPLDKDIIHSEIRMMANLPPNQGARARHTPSAQVGSKVIRTRKMSVEPYSKSQKAFVDALRAHRLVFGIGPAGTGKTYLALAVGVELFSAGLVDRIILSRPAVEAGERLGFLPGDIKEKADPYMLPLYDALSDFLPAKQIARMFDNKSLEIAPLAFMRGRTLRRAFILLDEAQNTTDMQMKMFLTRLGAGSYMAVTGDVSQIDLPKGVRSGLINAARRLKGIDDIAFIHFGACDVVRHPLVAKIIEAYDTAR